MNNIEVLSYHIIRVANPDGYFLRGSKNVAHYCDLKVLLRQITSFKTEQVDPELARLFRVLDILEGRP